MFEADFYPAWCVLWGKSDVDEAGTNLTNDVKIDMFACVIFSTVK